MGGIANKDGDLKNLSIKDRLLGRLRGVVVSKGMFILVVLVVVVAVGGIAANFSSQQSHNSGDDIAGITNGYIEKDGERVKLTEKIEGIGIVCLGQHDEKIDSAEFDTEKYDLVEVGNDEGQWKPRGLNIPEEGTLCMVINDSDEVVSMHLGFQQEEIQNVIDFVEGGRAFSLEKARPVYNMVSGKRTTIDDKYLFNLCDSQEGRTSIENVDTDNSDSCVMPVENPEYLLLAGDGSLRSSSDNSGGSWDPLSGIVSELSTTEVPVVEDKDEVVVLELFGTKRIYPIDVLVSYPMIIDEVQGFNYVITYDWLTNKVSVFATMINGKESVFRVVGYVYNSNLVLSDSVTGTWWQQFNGEGIFGSGAGWRLDRLPYKRIMWSEAKKFEGGELVGLSVDHGNPDIDEFYQMVDDYSVNDGLNYSVSGEVKQPKQEKTWETEKGWEEISYKFGYVLFR